MTVIILLLARTEILRQSKKNGEVMVTKNGTLHSKYLFEGFENYSNLYNLTMTRPEGYFDGKSTKLELSIGPAADRDWIWCDH